jgi:hypothetical protein
MTEKVNPSPNRPADAFTTAGAIAYGGGSRDGYIVSSSQPTELSKQDSEITESNFNNFQESSSSSSLTISIGAGEAFIFGSWVVSDNSPSANVTLQAGVTDQTVYLGWNKDSPDDVIIGLESEFSTTTSNSDQKIPLYSYDTDSNGVISKTDLRQIGAKNKASNTETENLTLAGNSLDSDGDGVFDNADVNALSSLSQGDSFTGYPLTSADISQLDSSITEIVQDVSTSLPAAGTEGRVLIESDTGRILYDDGSSLNEVGLSESQISHDNITNVSASDHHDEPTAGTAITDEGSNQFGLDTSTSVAFPNGIDSLPAPTSTDEAARKQYVDSVAAGLELKDSVAVSNHESNIDLTSSVDPNPIDGYTLTDGERILLKHQTNAVENGIYIAEVATDPTTWVRSDDMNEDSEVSQGFFTFIRNGTHANESYVVTSSDPLTVGTDDINWSQFSAAGEITAGTGLSKSGSSLSITQDGVTSTELAGDIDGADHSTEYFDESDTGVISSGDFGIIMTTELADSESLNISRASYHQIGDSDPVTPAPSGTEISVIDGNNSNTATGLPLTVLSGDGTTEYPQQTGTPLAQYTNNTGSTQTIVIGVDNGQNTTGSGSNINIQAGIIGRIE